MHWGMRTTFNNGLNGVSHARRQIPEDYSAQVLHLMVSTLWFKAYLPPTKKGETFQALESSSHMRDQWDDWWRRA
jgi:hypothetical protein